MSETAPEGQSEQPNDGGDKSGYTPPASQEELDRIISDRLSREKAKYTDYADLKVKAARLAEIEQANLSETERAAQRISAAEAEVAQVPAKVAGALRDSLIALGVIPEARKVLLTATDPEALIAQVKAIQELDTDRKKPGNRDPFAGRTPASGADNPMREFARDLFERAATD